MAHLWLPATRQFPNQCFITGLSGREHGPYLEVDTSPGRPFIDPRTRREGRMYWSFASWRTTVVQQDSPYKDILEAEVQKRTQELTDRIDELEAKLARDPAQVAFDRFHKLMAPTKQLEPAPEPVAVATEAPPEPDQRRNSIETGQRRHQRPRR